MNDFRLPEMIEPTVPEERAAAIRFCRANAHRHIETGERLSSDESSKQWKELNIDLPRAKWLWMWNYGRDEWDRPEKGKEVQP